MKMCFNKVAFACKNVLVYLFVFTCFSRFDSSEVWPGPWTDGTRLSRQVQGGWVGGSGCLFACVLVWVSVGVCVHVCACVRVWWIIVKGSFGSRLEQEVTVTVWWWSFQEYAVVLQARERQKITDHHKGYELVSRLCALIITTAPLYQSGAQGPSTIFHDQWFLPAMSPSRTSRTISFIIHFPSSLCSYSIPWLGKGLSMPFPHLPV